MAQGDFVQGLLILAIRHLRALPKAFSFYPALLLATPSHMKRS